MSWLISLVIAGVMFASEGNLSVGANHNLTEFKSAAEKIAGADETERFAQTYPLNADGKVSVSNVNGSIAVETWERGEVKFEYVKTADSKEALSEVEIKIDARKNAFSVETDYGDQRRNSGGRRNYGKLQIEYRLTVPRNAVLDEIVTVNGSVSIVNAGNLTKASTVNGQVKANNLRGTANLSTVNGTIEADFDQLPAGGRISLNTVNGTINLLIPSDADAIVKANTVNGSIVNDFNLPVRKGEYVGRDLYGKLGSGNAQIRLNSVNGTLSVKRKNDGKNVNPATDLLNAKTGNDWNNDDADNNFGVTAPKPPKSPRPPRPPMSPMSPNVSGIDDKETRRAVREALKNAGKQLENIKPELEQAVADGLRQAANINSKEMQAQIRDAFAEMANVDWTNGAPLIEEKSESFTVKGTPKVTVEAQNCRVAVRGWDKPEVRYSVTRISKNQAQKPLDLKAAQNGAEVGIRITNGAAANDGFYNETNRIRLEIFVPRKSNLKILADGEIRLEGVSGAIDLQGADEAINVRDAGGKLSVGTADGTIRVIGFRGDFDGKTADGTMNLEGEFQSFNAHAADGTIVLTLPENVDAVFESNAEIENRGLKLIRENPNAKLWRSGSGGTVYRMNVADGKVIVRGSGWLKTN